MTCAQICILHSKQIPLKREDLNDFVKCYNPANRHKRKATWTEEMEAALPKQAERLQAGSSKQNDSFAGRWRAYDYEELINRDKASLDIFWLKDKSLEDSENLPDPGILAHEIVEDLEAALEQFREIADDLGAEESGAS